MRTQLAALIKAGLSVVVDHGLNQRAERDDYKQLISSHGGRWRLVHLPVARDELIQRLSRRNASGNSGTIPVATLDWMIDLYEPPSGEGEELPHEALQRS